MGRLTNGTTPTGVIFGFLKTILALQSLFNTKHIVFCWDSKFSKRKEIFPGYKQKRKERMNEWTDEEEQFEKEFRFQMKKLRKEYLRRVGYRNIFCQKGYEGDDLIASICSNLPADDDAIIISGDHDLYQCIKFNVSFYNPIKGKKLTLQRFKKKYGIIPNQWATVKILAGCSTDEIPGIKGVGEKTAIKYLRRKLKKTSKIYQRIEEKSFDMTLTNCPLVCLPMKGTKTFKLKNDQISKKGWREVTEELGMKSLGNTNAVKKKKSNRKLY